MGQLVDYLETLTRNEKHEFNESVFSLKQAFLFLESIAAALQKLKGTPCQPSDFDHYIKPLLNFETEAKKHENSWRIVIDLSVENGVYSNDPRVQICTGAPYYNRYLLKFEQDYVGITRQTSSIVKEPDLAVIKSTFSPNPQSLAEVKSFYDNANIQRVAILGSARVFAHPDFRDSLTPEKGQLPPSKNQLHAQQYIQRVEIELNKFLDVMEREKTQYIVLNGGWAGVQEKSTGIPLISHCVGAISDAEQGYCLPPITIMPAAGAYDRVTTRADVYHSNPVLTKNYTPNIDTYFEVPGEWGDDSKYLVSLSTGLMVFEPYGFWTNIEIANGVIQGKPVAVVIDPRGKYCGKISPSEAFAEIKISLPDGTEGAYRIYSDAGEAAKWIHDTTAQLFKERSCKTTQLKNALQDLKKEDQNATFQMPIIPH